MLRTFYCLRDRLFKAKEEESAILTPDRLRALVLVVSLSFISIFILSSPSFYILLTPLLLVTGIPLVIAIFYSNLVFTTIMMIIAPALLVVPLLPLMLICSTILEILYGGPQAALFPFSALPPRVD